MDYDSQASEESGSDLKELSVTKLIRYLYANGMKTRRKHIKLILMMISQSQGI